MYKTLVQRWGLFLCILQSVKPFLGFVFEGSGDLSKPNMGIEVYTPDADINLKRLVDEYVQENLRSNRWSQKTLKDYTACCNLFLRYFGDVSLGSISYERGGVVTFCRPSSIIL